MEHIEIVFQNRDIAVCIKPVGIVSEEGTADDPGMPILLSNELGCEIFPVHRLDKAVGGLMVFAKNKKSAASLSQQIMSGDFIKCYYALVYGKTEESEVLEDLLYKDRKTNKTFVVKSQRKGVKKAKLSYEKVACGKLDEKEVSLVKVRLYTGRSHQIRVQFASRKHPLVGDRRYGAKDGYKFPELYSCFLSFQNPGTNERVTFESKPGNGMKMREFIA